MTLDDYILNHIEPEGDYLHRLWRATNIHTIHGRMVSGHLQGRLLKLLVLLLKPQRILEVGTFSGYSALCMAEGLRQVHLSRGAEGVRPMLYTYEINDEMEDFTRPWIEGSDVADYIDFRIGDAIAEAPRLGLTFDMAFLDGDKRTYVGLTIPCCPSSIAAGPSWPITPCGTGTSLTQPTTTTIRR